MKLLGIGIFLLTSLNAMPQTIGLDSNETKYFELIGFELDSNSNYKLFEFVCQWTETPYLYAGKSLEGIDCSSFVKELYQEVFNMSLKGTSSTLPNECDMVEKKQLEAGDLIFFKIYSDKISHVGVYLGDNKFVHASTKLGVTISCLSENYYTNKYFSAGRVSVLVDK